MIRRLTINGFRSFGNVSFELDSPSFFFGANGCGKSSILDVLFGLRSVLHDGVPVVTAFPPGSVPRWRTSKADAGIFQVFTLEIDGPDGKYEYTLKLSHFRELNTTRVFEESLVLESKPLFQFKIDEAILYDDLHTKVVNYPNATSRSALSAVPEGPNYKKIQWFRERVGRIHCLRIDAARMEARSGMECAIPSRDFVNFTSWYRHALLADGTAASRFMEDIREVFHGLTSLDLQDLGNGHRILSARFKQPEGGTDDKQTYEVSFDELSDGQRALIALYAAVHFLARGETTLCIDEPDNHISLQELQPWLIRLLDVAEEKGCQILLASHHPEIYNYLAADCGIAMSRNQSGASRVVRYEPIEESALTISEQIARGYQ
ncbi:MAG: AAA family ATPase [Candidatus Sumerlaeia bacterium]|nr:AAA family ATPase [Candidatus Sumerlaeia bacterium]